MSYSTVIPGLEGGPLLTNHPVFIKLLPLDGYMRPGTGFSGTPIMVQHGTGNPNSSAASEARWLVDDRASGSQQSYHYITDDKETWVCLPLNEHGWHAADSGGPGNMRGIACEMIESTAVWNDPARRAKCIENAAEIMGRTAARKKASGPEQHWAFNYMLPTNLRHDCPNKLRHVYINGRLAWGIYVERFEFYYNEEIASMGGKPVPTPEPATPIKAGDRVRVTENLNVRRGYGLSFPVIATLPAGTIANVGNDPDGRHAVDADGYTWINIAFGKDSGWAASSWLEKIAAPEPAPAPTPKGKSFEVLYGPIPVRKEPGFNGKIIGEFSVGSKGKVVDGPKQMDTLIWYLVDGDVDGWIPTGILKAVDVA